MDKYCKHLQILHTIYSTHYTLLSLCWTTLPTLKRRRLMLRNEMEMTSAEQQSPESRCWATMRGGHRLVLVVQTCKHYLVTVSHLTLIVTISIVTSWGVIVVFTPSLA